MEAQQPVLLSRAWSRGNLSGSLAHTAVFIPVAVCSLEGVYGLICLGPYLSEVPVTPFWCPLVQLLLLGHTLVFCFAVLGKGRGSCPVLCLSHTVLELPQLCLFQQRLLWTGSCSKTSMAVLTPGKPLPALGLSAVMFQEQDGCPLPPEVTGVTCLFLQLPCLSFSGEICIQL